MKVFGSVGCFLLVAIVLGACVAAECRDGSHAEDGKCVADRADAGDSGPGGTGGNGGAGGDGDAGLENDGGGQPVECVGGYQNVGGECVDIDECATENGGCDDLTTCVNTIGAHECSACPDGFAGDGHGADGCSDIDECIADNGGCDTQPMVSCTNTDGSRTCGVCPTGFSGDGVGDTGCVDINECTTDNGGCDPAATCTNTAGSFSCGACPSGYTGNGALRDGCVPELESLRVNPGLVSANFSPSATAFPISVGLMTRYIEVIATTTVTGGTITVGGAPIDAYGSRFHWIGATSASVPVVLTDLHGRTRTYTLSVTRESDVVQRAYVKTPVPAGNQLFGRVVASDGDTLAIAGSSTGQTYGVVSVYARSGTNWVWQTDLSGAAYGAYNSFGRDGLDVDGDTLAIGQSDYERQGYGKTGAVHIYARSNGVWAKQETLLAANGEADDLFGRSVALKGGRVVVGAPGEDASAGGGPSNNGMAGAGAAYVFTHTNGSWNQEAYLKAANAGANDAFGSDVDLYRSLVLVGSPGEDSSGVGANPAGDNSRSDSGAAYLYERSLSGSWTQVLFMKNTQTYAAADSRLGASVAFGTETQFVVGAPGAERAYLFHSPEPSVWTQLQSLSADGSGPDNFGSSVAMWGPGTVVVSAGGDDGSAVQVNGVHDDNAQDSGAAYVFLRTSDVGGSSFGRDYYLKTRNSEAGDGWIGVDTPLVAIAHDVVVVAAPREDGMLGGLVEIGPTASGDDDPSPVREAGAAYIFR